MLDGSGGKTGLVWRFQIDTFFFTRVDDEKAALLNGGSVDESRSSRMDSTIEKTKANTFLRFRIRGDAFSRVLSTTTPFTCQVILRAQNFARSRDRASRVHG